jgi:hypothetical protein
VEGETGPCIETVVMCDVDGTEEVSINVEESIDIKDEIPEALIFSPIKTEQEVRLWVVCVSWWQLTLLCHLLPQKEIVKLHFTISCFVLYCGCHIRFETWIAVLKRGDFLEVIAINGRIILECILKK